MTGLSEKIRARPSGFTMTILTVLVGGLVAVGLAWSPGALISAEPRTPAGGAPEPATATDRSPSRSGPNGPPTTPPVSGSDEPAPDSPRGDLEHRYRGEGSTVAILGDSLTVQARDDLRVALADRSLKIAALYGEGLSGGPLSAQIGGSIMGAMVEEYSLDPPDVVVIALGTNDVWHASLGPESFRAAWKRMEAAFSRSCVVGVTVTETTEGLMYDTPEALAVNRVIRQGSDVTVDWAHLGTGADLTGFDGIHLSERGRVRFARLVARGVERCSYRPTAPGTASTGSAGVNPNTRP